MTSTLFPLLLATVGLFLIVGVQVAVVAPQWPRRTRSRAGSYRRPMFAGPSVAGGWR